MLEQWKAVKAEINESPGLRARKFHELWPDFILHYTDEYPDLLRLVAITLLIPTGRTRPSASASSVESSRS